MATLFLFLEWLLLAGLTVQGVLHWTLVITNSLGPVKLLCYIEILLYPGCKNNKIQRNFELWDQENYFMLYQDFVTSMFFITRVHCNV